MKSTAFIFHGTEGHPQENWFPWMKEQLEQKGYEVIVPQFPSPPIVAAKISEWFNVLDEYMDRINEDAIIIGHSLGGVFTLRVLEKLNKPIRLAALAGTPIGVKPILNYDRDSSFSGFDFDWAKIRTNAKDFIVYQSDDDPYVCLENGQQLAKNLSIELSFIPKAGHFNKRAGYVTFASLRDQLFDKLSELR